MSSHYERDTSPNNLYRAFLTRYAPRSHQQYRRVAVPLQLYRDEVGESLSNYLVHTDLFVPNIIVNSDAANLNPSCKLVDR